VLLTIAGATMVHVYLISPIRKLFCPFRVISSKQIAERTWELAFARADGRPFEFEAGQFIWISLRKGPFTLAENPFSIASAPSNATRVELVIKEVGDFSRSLGGVEAGQPAWVDGPHGSLKLPGPEVPGIGLIAGGVGIVPLLSILREMQATGDSRPVVLLYGNRLDSQIVYREELERMAGAEQVFISHVLSEPPADWEGLRGMIEPDAIAAAFGAHEGARDWTYLMCGPPGMLDVAEEALIARGVDPRRILSERFVYD
jgi:NAD(P)H-flavin reductase